MTDKSGQLTLTEAIELLKDYRKGDFVDDYKLCEAIDTVVAELEKPLPTDEQIIKSVSENVKSSDGELLEIVRKLAIKSFVTGAKWMRDLIQERRAK